uniref:Uncharacterized protein n=1 Tax=Mola mola TaxID=94237 RepID=A0A3Q4AG05_MOLML
MTKVGYFLQKYSCSYKMEEENSSNLNLTAESALLVKALLDIHLYSHERWAEEDQENRNINWVANKDFTVEEGIRQIGEYIKTWQLQPCWLYSLDFLCSTEQQRHTFHHFQARFSKPTPDKPIQGTASVYFAVYVSKVREETLPVDVLFIVESNQRIHTPGRTTFTDKWLVDVIESKTLLRSLNI